MTSDQRIERRGQVADRRSAHGDRRGQLVDRRGLFADRRRANEVRYRAPLDAALQSQLAAWQEAQRQRIAADLHDSIGSSLCTIRLKLEGAIEQLPAREGQWMPSAPLLEVVADVSRAMEEVRRIAMDLRPAILDDLGIVTTIGWLARQLEVSQRGIRVEKQIEVAEARISDLLKTAIFRIAQESLNNVAKHGGARHVRISLCEDDLHLQLTIEDDGRGFEMPSVFAHLDPSAHFGIANMRQRANSSGGVLVIRSEPGSGTHVSCSWPRPGR